MEVSNRAMPVVWVIAGVISVGAEPTNHLVAQGWSRTGKDVESLTSTPVRGGHPGGVTTQPLVAGDGAAMGVAIA